MLREYCKNKYSQTLIFSLRDLLDKVVSQEYVMSLGHVIDRQLTWGPWVLWMNRAAYPRRQTFKGCFSILSLTAVCTFQFH